MRFDIKLIESNSEITRVILQALQSHINRNLSTVSSSVIPKIKGIVADALRAEPEYASLTAGKLKYELGIDSSTAVDNIVNKLVDTIELDLQPVSSSSRSLSGGFTIRMMKSDDLDGVIADADAFVNDQKRGYQLPWLEWLLLRGNDTIVSNYSVKIGNNPNSRTGNAIMVSSASNWRVPTEFVGTSSNNWTTRAIASANSSIAKAMEQSIKDIL